MYILSRFRTPKTLAISSGALLLLLFMQSCGAEEKKKAEAEPIAENKLTYSVAPAPEWTGVFQRESGWFGGDGIFAIPYSGRDNEENDSILFLFSDTMFGEIKDGKLEPGFVMVNNSVAVFQKDKDPSSTEFFVNEDASGKKTAFVIPDAGADHYYWLGDGVVNSDNGKLYLFSYQIRNLDNDSQFPFEEVGNDLLVIDDKGKFPLEATAKLPIPFSDGGETGTRISFGAGLYTEGDSIYIYGVRGMNKELVVARTTTNKLEDFSSWEFRTADGWSKDLKELQVLAESVSNELSVSQLENGQYALVYQGGGIYPKIYMQFSNDPYGPFGEMQEIWDTSTEVTDPDLFTYNAKAHPAISEPGELLVSYNVNSFKFFEIIEDQPQLYRPRFVKIKFNTSE